MQKEVERLRLLIDRRVDGIIILTGHVNQPATGIFTTSSIVATGHNINTEKVRTFSINNRLGGVHGNALFADLGMPNSTHCWVALNQVILLNASVVIDKRLLVQGIEYDPELVVQGDFC